jgi:hypothetical protein
LFKPSIAIPIGGTVVPGFDVPGAIFTNLTLNGRISDSLTPEDKFAKYI